MRKRELILNNYIINGRQLSGDLGGVQRYLREILKALDVISKPGEVKVAVPVMDEELPQYKNIEIIRIGKNRGLVWEQIDYPLYLACHKKQGVNLCTTVPFFCPKGIVTIHDIMPIKYPEIRKAFKLWNYLLLRLNYYIAIKNATLIFTDTNNVKNDIIDYYKVQKEKVMLVTPAWQHMNEIRETPFASNFIEEKKFYLALSSNRWQKNFRWIEQVAKHNPDEEFVIVGAEDKQQKAINSIKMKNVHYTGFLSDEQIKWLYSKCKAFIFPSICEGFGIPPLEALSCGAEVFCSNSSCIPEVMGEAAVFFDPYQYNVNINELYLQAKCNITEVDKNNTLERFSWQRSAEKLLQVMRNDALFY